MARESDPYRNNPSREIEIYAADAVRSWVGSSGQVDNTGQGTGGGPDFEIAYNDGRTAIGEVGWHEDRKIRQMWGETVKKEKHQQIPLSPGAGQWSVGLFRGASIKHLYSCLPTLVDDLLQLGQTELMIQGSWPPGPAADEARRLGIQDMSRVSDSNPDFAIFFMPVSGGIVPTDPNIIATWVGEVVADPDYGDMTAKLLKLNADERHIFIMSGSLTSFGIGERLRRLNQARPTQPPDVPDGITHVWVASMFSSSEHPSPLGLWNAETGWVTVPRPA